MALQKPIVSFDLPENRFTAQGSALYAQPNNEYDFAKKLITLMDNPEMRRLMGRIGRNRIEEELSWANQEINLLEVYQLIS